MSATDIIYFVVTFSVLAISLFCLAYAGDKIVDSLHSNTQLNQTSSVVKVLDATKSLSSRYDYCIFIVLLAIALGLIITGWLIGGHPIFMIVYFFVVIATTVFSVLIANVWETLTSNAAFIDVILKFAITNHIMTNFAYYTFVIGFIGICAMFAKLYYNEGGM